MSRFRRPFPPVFRVLPALLAITLLAGGCTARDDDTGQGLPHLLPNGGRYQEVERVGIDSTVGVVCYQARHSYETLTCVKAWDPRPPVEQGP